MQIPSAKCVENIPWKIRLKNNLQKFTTSENNFQDTQLTKDNLAITLIKSFKKPKVIEYKEVYLWKHRLYNRSRSLFENKQKVFRFYTYNHRDLRVRMQNKANYTALALIFWIKSANCMEMFIQAISVKFIWQPEYRYKNALIYTTKKPWNWKNACLNQQKLIPDLTNKNMFQNMCNMNKWQLFGIYW